jgi:diacylglycerol kinase (ATP)
VGAVAPPDLAVLIRRVLLIANPASRHGWRLTSAATSALQSHGVECDVVLTAHPGHAAELALERGGGYEAVFTLGGDGTAMEVASALARTGPPLGVLPGGTGNLLARALGIPLDVRRAVAALLAGDTTRIDLGRLGSGRHFAIAAGAGIDADMVAETPSWLKHRFGISAYTLVAARAALRTVIRGDYFQVRLTVDGVVHERQAAAVIVANFGAILADRITFGPEIRADDGVLDVCVYAPRGLRDASRIMWRLLRKDFATDPCMLYQSGRHIRIETTPPREFQADGELLGMTPVEIVMDPLACHLLIPRRP